ncbi:DUF1254 domain-containing protein [Aliirhizobium smilacinae]|uniref:DUF1254 domain-containing protein n=1 Tax=Aliirhizobium smilacinae TaxID=1395944 RepID=A0A5C4XQN3_9HYPH|nr:DUF1254 domain-containing protein [Rhizobium smilacinae]TNM65702.1 DUF1254 domain-containing protein [Rhizobium smilacinae]
MALSAVLLLSVGSYPASGDAVIGGTMPVTVENFSRAETDVTMAAYAKEDAFGKFMHARKPASIDDQKIVRMNRDTLYSIGVFDLDAGPVTLSLPDAGKRYMMAQVIDEDHYTHDIAYAPETKSYSKETIGTRYLVIIIRTLVDPQSETDIRDVHELQDKTKAEQASSGKFEVPNWDQSSQAKVRDALKVLGSTLQNSERMFGSKEETDPVRHLIGAAVGWGGNPSSAAIYLTSKPKDESGKAIERIIVKDVPIDGFWSISVYNGKGYFEKNDLNAYSINNLTAKPSNDGSIVVQFGGCNATTINCIPIMEDWNYTVRLYRPRPELSEGKWKFPEPELVK